MGHEYAYIIWPIGSESDFVWDSYWMLIKCRELLFLLESPLTKTDIPKVSFGMVSIWFESRGLIGQILFCKVARLFSSEHNSVETRNWTETKLVRCQTNSVPISVIQKKIVSYLELKFSTFETENPNFLKSDPKFYVLC